MRCKIGVVVKKGCTIPPALERALDQCLRRRGVELVPDLSTPGLKAILVLGGDGTFLRAVPAAYEKDIPLLGINLGRLGFLTEITLEEACPVLEALVQDNCALEERLLLEVHYQKETFYALNEAAIIKGPLGHMIHLRVHREEKEITIYHGDGLIISTPTGSTAYKLSAGGPIVYPTSDVFVLTPVCPFMLSARPIVIPATRALRVELLSRTEEVHLLLDGYINKTLRAGERVILRKAPRPLKIVRSMTRDYFEILRTKLGWSTPKV